LTFQNKTPYFGLVDIREIEKASTGFWFFPQTMKLFKSRVSSVAYQGPGGTFFVSSEVPPSGIRIYSVREMGTDGRVLSTDGHFSNRKSAHRSAEKMARGETQ